MLSNISKPFVYTFYLLAQNPNPNPIPSATSKSNLIKIVSKIPVFLLICVSLYVTLYSLKNDQYVTRNNIAREIIHVLSIISSSIANFVTAFTCMFLYKRWTELQESFNKLEIEFQDLLPSVNVELKKFRKNYLLKCSLIFALYAFSILSRIYLHIEGKILSYMFVLAFINELNAFQVIFYVDLSKFFLKTIIQAFRDVDGGVLTKCEDEKFIESKFLTSMKKLHWSIWKTVEKINEYFGLFLICYIVQQFLIISYDIYWIIMNRFSVSIWLSLG